MRTKQNVNCKRNCITACWCTGGAGADVLYNKFNVTSSGLPADPPRDPNDNGCLVDTTDYWKFSQCTNEHRVVCQSGQRCLHDFYATRRVSNAFCFSAVLFFFLSHPRGAGGSPFPPYPFSSQSFALFYLFLFSLVLTIFFFCPSLSFLPE